MICRSCSTESGHIRTIHGVDSCHACGGFTESGKRTEGILTRNALRIRQESVLHEGDTIHPYEMDKNRKKLVPSQEFIKQFPNQAHEYFTDDQLIDAGYKELPAQLKKNQEKIMTKIAKEEAQKEFIGTHQQTKEREKTLTQSP